MRVSWGPGAALTGVVYRAGKFASRPAAVRGRKGGGAYWRPLTICDSPSRAIDCISLSIGSAG